MKIAIVSDIHGNLEALESVLINISDCDYIINLGDIVGYNYGSLECIDIMYELYKSKKLLDSCTGNHDYACVTGDYSGFNTNYGIDALVKTRALINHSSKDYFGMLKELTNNLSFEEGIANIGNITLRCNHCLTLNNNGKNVYKTFDLSEKDLALILPNTYYLTGHNHVPSFRLLINYCKGAINPGSVGQPRTGIPKANYAIISIDNITEASIYSVEYDIEKVIYKNRKLGLHPFISHRLQLGI